MRRSVAMLLGVLAPLCAGCDSSSFVPPPPPELAATVDPAIEPAVKIIEIVLRADDTSDRMTLEGIGRVDAAGSRISFRSSASGKSDAAERQADMIRKATLRKVSALIVEAEPDPRVAKALGEAKAAGVPVLLIARPLADGGPALPVVTLEPPEQSASALVKAAIEDAKNAKLPGDGTAIILVPQKPDIFSDDRVAGLKAALKDAGIATPEVVTHDGTQADADKLLRERLKADPKITLVFAEDSEGLFAAIGTRDHLKKERPFIVAGYAELGSHLNQSVLNQTAGIANHNIAEMGHVVFRLARRLADGGQVDARTVVPSPFRRYASAVPKDPPPDSPTSGRAPVSEN